MHKAPILMATPTLEALLTHQQSIFRWYTNQRQDKVWPTHTCTARTQKQSTYSHIEAHIHTHRYVCMRWLVSIQKRALQMFLRINELTRDSTTGGESESACGAGVRIDRICGQEERKRTRKIVGNFCQIIEKHTN